MLQTCNDNTRRASFSSGDKATTGTGLGFGFVYGFGGAGASSFPQPTKHQANIMSATFCTAAVYGALALRASRLLKNRFRRDPN